MRIQRQQRQDDNAEVKLVPVHVPVVSPSMRYNLQRHLNREDDDERVVRYLQYLSELVTLVVVVDKQEARVDHNSGHNDIFKRDTLHNSEAVATEAVDGDDGDDLWVRVHKQALDLDPLFLLLREVLLALSLLQLVIELVNDDRYEQVHDEERGHEDIHDVDGRHDLAVFNLAYFVHSDRVNSIEHHVGPHLERRDLEEG